ncbi:uncharacterized protein FFB14_15849 [Fusarium fujikuroi]|nr:uncharacterized protein FFB14_15849 [Fusarium fujikuroi]
MYLSVKRLI